MGESEIVYKIETVELRSEKFRSSAHSILRRGGRRLRCGRGEVYDVVWKIQLLNRYWRNAQSPQKQVIR